MIHPLKTVSYVADIDGCLVVMAHRTIPTSPGQQLKLTCHVLDTADPREVAMVIGQAFSTAYKEFLKTNGVEEKSLDQFEYQHVLKCQSKSEMELNSLKDENKTKEITFAKGKGEILGLMVIDSGYGSAIPTCMIAHMSKTGAAGQSGLLNVGDQILSINGVSLVGLPLKATIEQIKVSHRLIW
jgi:amyloid beta (A4) precursor protein-binding family A protein 1 (X11)